MKKFELTTETKFVLGITFYRIRALIAFGNVDVGDLGGWIEKESNLAQDGDAWVSGDAWVFGDAWVSGNARVFGNARVSGNAWVSGNARVFGDARVSGDAEVVKPVHLLTIRAIGSRNGCTTFFRTKDKQIKVSCGCFLGTIAEFAEKVKQTHGDSKHAKTYAIAIELAKAQIEDVEVN